MKREITLSHEFVEYIPDDLKGGTLYVSMAFATVAHKCCCGCGNEVVTPLSPTDWKLIFDGESISLDPSIGNWSLPCQSHYWITAGTIRWSRRWSQEEIDTGRHSDQLTKTRYFAAGAETQDGESRRDHRLWRRLTKWWN